MNRKVLGLIAMICSPTMFAEIVVSDSTVVVGIASMLFMIGSFCSLLGLWQLKATGSSKWGRGVLILQMVLVSMAFLFSLFEATQILAPDHILFIVTDIAWPLSMFTMTFVGVTTAVVGSLPGWRRYGVLPSGLVMITSLLASMVLGTSIDAPGFVAASVTALSICWFIMAFTVFSSDAGEFGSRGLIRKTA